MCSALYTLTTDNFPCHSPTAKHRWHHLPPKISPPWPLAEFCPLRVLVVLLRLLFTAVSSDVFCSAAITPVAAASTTSLPLLSWALANWQANDDASFVKITNSCWLSPPCPDSLNNQVLLQLPPVLCTVLHAWVSFLNRNLWFSPRRNSSVVSRLPG